MNSTRKARLRRLIDAEAKRRADPAIAEADAKSRARAQARAARRYLQEQMQEAIARGEPVSPETMRTLLGRRTRVKTNS